MSKDRINLETYNDLVSAIYDAANDPARWNEFLALLAQALNSHGIALRLLDPQSYFPTFSTTYGYGEGFPQEYTEHYHQPRGQASPGDDFRSKGEARADD